MGMALSARRELDRVPLSVVCILPFFRYFLPTEQVQAQSLLLLPTENQVGRLPVKEKMRGHPAVTFSSRELNASLNQTSSKRGMRRVCRTICSVYQ